MTWIVWRAGSPAVMVRFHCVAVWGCVTVTTAGMSAGCLLPVMCGGSVVSGVPYPQLDAGLLQARFPLAGGLRRVAGVGVG
jgi:hypothetical protein